jgi:putative selenium metabolism protein SsnA
MTAMAPADSRTLALCGATVVRSLNPPELIAADVVISDGRVAAVGAAPAGVRRRDCSGCLLLPGNVCAHTHLYSQLARGMPYALDPPLDFTQILQRVWWRLDRALDEEAVRLSALVGGMEALLAGTTTLVDHHASPNAIDGSLDVIAAALEALGIRSVLCYEVSDRDGPERAGAGVAENRRFLATRRPLARGMVGAHASFTLSEDTLAACVDLARGAGSGLHVHVAEDVADQRDAVARFGIRVVHRLAAAGALAEGALLAHCIHVDEGEVAVIRGSGAAVAHNARSNMNNAVGHIRLGLLGRRVALGTDGIGADMLAESKAAFFRAREADVATGAGWPLERLAEGARVAGRAFGEERLGRVEPGAPADLAVLRYGPPTPLDGGNLAGHWVFGLDARQVRDVLVAGELVVADGRLVRVDQDELAAKAAAGAARLWRRLEQIAPHTFAPEGSRTT